MHRKSYRLFCLKALCSQVGLSSGIESVFEPDNVGSNPAWSTEFNQVITVGKLLIYNCFVFQIHSSVL